MSRSTAGQARTASPRTCLVLVPGLADPLPALPPTPTLDRLFAVASVKSGDELTDTLLGLFGAAAHTGSAPYALAGDDPGWDQVGWWLHAAPVHLRADRDRLRLFDARLLAISEAEAADLVGELNAHFAADGLYFHAPVPARWYVRPPAPLALQAPPVQTLTGRPLARDVATGADAQRWTALMNEAQMLLFQSPVNRARAAAGRPAINGLWTWGGGTWQRLTPPVPLARVWGDDPLLRGLAAAAGLAATPRPATQADWPAGLTLALVSELADALATGDEAGCAGVLLQLDEWLAAACEALRRGRLDRIDLDAGDGRRWCIAGRDLGWRGPGALQRWLGRPPGRFTEALASEPGGPAGRG